MRRPSRHVGLGISPVQQVALCEPGGRHFGSGHLDSALAVVDASQLGLGDQGQHLERGDRQGDGQVADDHEGMRDRRGKQLALRVALARP